MSTMGLVFGWIFGLLFAALTIITLMSGKFIPAILLLILALLLLPPIRTYAYQLTGVKLPGWVRTLLITILVLAYPVSLVMGVMQIKNVYATPEAKAEHMQLYDERMLQWPSAYEDIYVDTSYGKVHVIVSGPEDAPPVLLLNAAAMSAWSWLYNIEVLNPQYRTYAIDTIGEVGKSELSNPNRYPANGKEYADLYVEIAEAVGVEKSYVVGASFGGFIATNYALYYPEKVEKLALLGPMGITPETMKTAIRIMGTQFFPLGPIQKSTARWALGDDPYVQDQAGEWFQIVLTKTAPKEARPVTFTSEQLESMQIPVLLVIGTRDALTGDPEAVKELANHTPGIQIEVLDSGHLIGAEQKERVNELVQAFFSNNE